MLANPKVKKGGIALIVLIFGYMFVLPKMQSANELPLEIPEHANPGHTYHLESTVYNLLTPLAQQPRYLKLGVTFEFETEDVAFYFLEGEALEVALEHFSEELGPKVPIISDAVSALVAAKTLEEISSVNGRASLKTELQTIVAEIVGEPHLTNIFFPEYLFQ